METYILVFFFGFASSLHCVAMCGTLLSCANKKRKDNLLSTVTSSIGRMFSYTIMGVISGGLGFLIIREPLINKGFAILLIIIMCSYTIMVFKKKTNFFEVRLPLVSNFISNFVPADNYTKNFLLGFFIVLLPCPTFYAMVSVAAASGSFFSGGLTMFVFGLGTFAPMVGSTLILENIYLSTKEYSNKFTGVIYILLILILFLKLNNEHINANLNFIGEFYGNR